MTATNSVTIWCDANDPQRLNDFGGLQKCHDFIETGERTIAKARKRAREGGWLIRRDEDVCPVCAWKG